MSFDSEPAELLPDNYDLREAIKDARKVYDAQESIPCPFFNGPVTLNSDGFNHLTHKPNRMPRNINEQKLKLRLLKKALRVIRKTGTVQEYRKRMEPIGHTGKDGFTKMREVEYWAFHDIVGDKTRFLMRVITRRIGDGKIHFWSVMPHGKINKQKLYQDGIEEE
jgi:hypothetical protein